MPPAPTSRCVAPDESARPVEEHDRFELITAFDAIHDQADTAWGEEKAQEMLADASFNGVDTTHVDADILNTYSIARTSSREAVSQVSLFVIPCRRWPERSPFDSTMKRRGRFGRWRRRGSLVPKRSARL